MTVVSSSSPLQSLRIVASDIKIAHSVFALPFALLAAFMAAGTAGQVIVWTTLGGQIVLIIGAMVFARTCAMLANRLLDRHIDARNPRTSVRAIPAGRMTVTAALGWFTASAVLFMTVCCAFGIAYANWWPAILGVPVLAWICVYGLFKRFTVWCHLYLGSSLALSPIAAAIAVAPDQLAQPSLWLLSGMVLCWVAGFDVIYALQDVEIDRSEGLHSVPSRFGARRGLWISRALHSLAIGLLITAWAVDARFEWLFGAGVAIVAALLVCEHATVHRWGTTKIALAFFTLNGIISCVLGALGILDVVL